MESLTEAEVLAMLDKRYAKTSVGAARYVTAHHVPNLRNTLNPSGPLYKYVADYLAQDTHWKYLNPDGTHHYQSHQDPNRCRYRRLIGHEIKVSRSDWLVELRNPDKAQAWKQHCDQWWLVAPKHVARIEELPPGWGWSAPTRSGVLRTVSPAPPLEPVPLPADTTIALMRAIQKTATTR